MDYIDVKMPSGGIFPRIPVCCESAPQGLHHTACRDIIKVSDVRRWLASYWLETTEPDELACGEDMLPLFFPGKEEVLKDDMEISTLQSSEARVQHMALL